MRRMAYRVRGEESKGVMGDRGAKWGVYITSGRRDWLTVSPTMDLRIGHSGWKVTECGLTVLASRIVGQMALLDVFVLHISERLTKME